MGIYFNPNNQSFTQARNSQIYADKTGLLSFLNKNLSTDNKCIALSHARRFGKSHAAGMIDAYYSLGSSSASLFDDTLIAQDKDYKKYLNKYNVIHLDMSSVWDFHKVDYAEFVHERITEDLKNEFGDSLDYSKELYLLINDTYRLTKIQFIIIIDEWDCIIRNSSNQDLVHSYLQFLHSLFKSEESKSFLALAYITGILPIKKINDESALNNFREFTMLKSKAITEYYGFTEDEVKGFCEKYNMDYETARAWYDGYLIDGKHMYNPNSVVQAMLDQDFDAYWKNTSSFDTINNFITMNFDGLKDDILELLAGGRIKVNVDKFKNDLTVVESKDEALTALIHLGYLGYDAERSQVYIPNFEVAKAYQAALQTGGWSEITKTLNMCENLLWATIDRESDMVAELLELAHDTYCSALKYNDENSLACAITMAYFTAPAYYNVIRELPSGKGFADFAFVPRADSGNKPAMIIELKWDKSADTAINQIKERRYGGNLKGYGQDILLVGINYDKDSHDKKHTCIIERLVQE